MGVALGRFSSNDFQPYAQLYCGIFPFSEILIQQRQPLYIFFLAVLSPAALCITHSSFVFLRRGAGGNEADRPREPFKRTRRAKFLAIDLPIKKARDGGKNKLMLKEIKKIATFPANFNGRQTSQEVTGVSKIRETSRLFDINFLSCLAV